MKRIDLRPLFPALLLAVTMCGGPRTTGDGTSLGHAAVANEALSASTTLSGGLTGKIQPITGAYKFISNGMPGDAAAEADGSASYRLPIWTPDGVNGMQPTLAVEYSSESGTGLLGPRWRLTGLSTITRCKQTRAQDGAQAPIRLNGSTFCLDGRRLTQNVSNPAEFHPENDTFVKVVGTQDASGNFTSFVAYEKDGRVLYYGRTPSSRLHGNVTGTSGADFSYAYYVDKIQDRYGNSILVKYANAVASLSNAKTNLVQELEPSTISWGATGDTQGQRSLSLQYESLPAGARTDTKHTRWVAGLGIGAAQYLSTISVYGPDGTGAAPMLKQYKFGYSSAPATRTGGALITGDRVLSSISECDANGYCKKATTLQWESGSTAYHRVDLGAADAFFDSYEVQTQSGEAAPFPSVADTYRRVLVADLNGDGRDDVIYRGYVPPHPANTQSCLGWISRTTANDPVHGLYAATPMPFYMDPDYSCGFGPPNGGNATALPSDPLFTDIDGDGLMDAVVATYDDVFATNGQPYISGYHAYLNTTPTAGGPARTISFGLPITFLDTVGEDPTTLSNPIRDAGIAFGDLDGDGLLDLLRVTGAKAPVTGNPPNCPASSCLYSSNNSLSQATLAGAPLTVRTTAHRPYGGQFQYDDCTGATCNKALPVATFPDGKETMAAFTALDLDGDGTAEVVRVEANATWDSTSGTFRNATTTATSASLQTTIPSDTTLWADINGDGLPDAISLEISVDASKQSSILAAFNTGIGFSSPVTTTIPNSSWVGGPVGSGDNGVRVVDVNLDGRQDLLFVGHYGTADANHTVDSSAQALLSNGDGTFTFQDTTIAETHAVQNIVNGQSTQKFFPFASDVADLNGDGLPDLVQLEPGKSTAGYACTQNPNGLGTHPEYNKYIWQGSDGGLCEAHLFAYIRQGSAPERVTAINEGNGRTITLNYAPLVGGYTSNAFYNVDTTPAGAGACAADPHHLQCVTHGRWAVQSISIGGASEAPGPTTQTYQYRGGVIDKGGRGFLGFVERDVYGPGSLHTTITYNPLQRDTFVLGYVYPFAMVPQTVRTDADTLDANRHHYESHTYNYLLNETAYSTYTVLPTAATHSFFDCASTNATSCTGSSRLLASQSESFVFDRYGNETSHIVTNKDGSGNLVESDTVVTTYNPADLSGDAVWLVRLPQRTVATSATSTKSTTRTTLFTEDPTVSGVTGLLSGDIRSVEVEPTGDATTHRLVTVSRDARGRVTSKTDGGAYAPDPTCSSACNPSCNTRCNANCADAGAGIGSCVGSCVGGCVASCVLACEVPTVVRSTGYKYEDADGVYVTTTTDALAHSSRVWRHPGLGVVVEADDPNGLPATKTYDTFGRLLSETAMSGASVSYGYQDSANPGLTTTITPEGKSSRQMTLQTDPWGREMYRSAPIDATKTLQIYTWYDTAGRTRQRGVSGSNLYSYTYDDLGRLVSDCHQTAAGTATYCRTSTFDGLTTTFTDESGLVTTTVADAMGRHSVERASTMSDVHFIYGPFSLLASEAADLGGAGVTQIAYDVLGRPTSVTRSDAGARGTTYDAFGDVATSYKLNGTSQVDVLNYAYDLLGRVTSITTTNAVSAPVSRHFFWDASQDNPTTPAPYAIGKIVDVFDGPLPPDWSPNSLVHYTYGPNGLVATKGFGMGAPPTLYYGAPGGWSTFQYSYDSQGRISTETYPSWENWSSPLTISYAYDPYNGDVASLTDMTNPSTPVWTATSRNVLGQITGEQLSPAGGVAITRTTAYAMQTGAISSQTLGPSLTYSYGYYPDGLPSAFTMSGGAWWSESFQYDNARRLTSWTPDTNAPAVSYSYDSPGNLGQRSFVASPNGETVTYASSTSQGTVTVVQGSTPTRTDAYPFDALGRVTGTPAVTLTYDATDAVAGVTERSSGSVDTIVHDGFGNRILTTYGTVGLPTWGGYRMQMDDYELSNLVDGLEERCRLRAGGRIVGDLVRTGPSTARMGTLYLTDGVGSVVGEASSSNGVAYPRARRDPYGNLLTNASMPALASDPAGTDPDGTSRLGYGGHERDARWGLVDMKARFYSPALGRFVSPDSQISRMDDRREYNPFSYAVDDPVAANDPTGHDDECDDCGYSPPPPPWDPGPVGVGPGPSPGMGSPPGNNPFPHPPAPSNPAPIFFPPPPPPNYFIQRPINGVRGAFESANAGTTASSAIRTTGQTEAPEPVEGTDVIGFVSDSLDQIAENTSVRLSWPLRFGPNGFQLRQSFGVSLDELESNKMLRNVTEFGLDGSYKLRGLELLKGATEGMGNSLIALNLSDASDAHNRGDTQAEGRYWLEALYAAAAAAEGGALGFGAGFVWFEFKLAILNAEMSAQRAESGDGPQPGMWNYGGVMIGP